MCFRPAGIRDKDAILNCLRNVEWIEGMKELLEAAKKELNAKIIVVSDSHTLHIEQVSGDSIGLTYPLLSLF